MKIEKRNYSKSPWRLVNDEGKEITAKMPFEHPTLGWTYVDGPICGDTKAECVQKALDMLKLLMLRKQHGDEQMSKKNEAMKLAQPEQEPVAWTTMPDAYDWTFISGSSDPNGKLDGKWHPLYTTPQPAQQGGGNLPPPLEQQPVACVIDGDLYFHHEIDWEDLAYQGHGVELLYTAPQPRQWQGLTHDERDAWQDRHGLMVEHEVIHELDDLLREKNT